MERFVYHCVCWFWSSNSRLIKSKSGTTYERWGENSKNTSKSSNAFTLKIMLIFFSSKFTVKTLIDGNSIFCQCRHRVHQMHEMNHSHQTQSNTLKHIKTHQAQTRPQTQSITIKHNQTQSNTIKHNQTQSNTIKHNQTQSNTIKHNQTQSNTIKYNRPQCHQSRQTQSQSNTHQSLWPSSITSIFLDHLKFSSIYLKFLIRNFINDGFSQSSLRSCCRLCLITHWR